MNAVVLTCVGVRTYVTPDIRGDRRAHTLKTRPTPMVISGPLHAEPTARSPLLDSDAFALVHCAAVPDVAYFVAETVEQIANLLDARGVHKEK